MFFAILSSISYENIVTVILIFYLRKGKQIQTNFLKHREKHGFTESIKRNEFVVDSVIS